MAKVSTLYSGAAEAAAGVVVIIIAALGNQGLAGWRDSHAASGNAWISDLFSPLNLVGWRFTQPSGHDATDHWLAPLVFNVVVVVLTWFFAANAVRGHGPLGRFFGAWGATALAGGIAGIACTYLVYVGSNELTTGLEYRQTLGTGLIFGFLAGVIAGLAALLLGRSGSHGVTNASTSYSGSGSSLPLSSSPTIQMPDFGGSSGDSPTLTG
ncbi:MAG TPA: hypothetical protein VGM10_05695 [Actinocrinis sp.]|jgi:hypothetical protein